MSANATAIALAGANALTFTGIVPATLATTGYSGPLDVRSHKNVRFQCKTAAATNTPVGVFTVEGTDEVQKVMEDRKRGLYGNADTAQWTSIPIPTGATAGLSGTALALASGTLTMDGSAAVNFIINLLDPPACVRLKYTRTSGGGAATGFRALGSIREV